MDLLLKRGLALVNERGFSLVEVLAGVMIFAFGMLGVAALLTATVRDNSFSGSLGEANLFMANKVDILMGKATVNFEDSDLQDITGDALGGLGYYGCAAGGGCAEEPDFTDLNQGSNGKFTVFWNVAEDIPVIDTKTISVIVTWTDRDSLKKISCRAIAAKVN